MYFNCLPNPGDTSGHFLFLCVVSDVITFDVSFPENSN